MRAPSSGGGSSGPVAGPPWHQQGMHPGAGSGPFLGTDHPGRAPSAVGFGASPGVPSGQGHREVCGSQGWELPCGDVTEAQPQRGGWKSAWPWSRGGHPASFGPQPHLGALQVSKALRRAGRAPRGGGTGGSARRLCAPPRPASPPHASEQTPRGKEQVGAVPTSRSCPRPWHPLLRTSSAGSPTAGTGTGVSAGTEGQGPQQRRGRGLALGTGLGLRMGGQEGSCRAPGWGGGSGMKGAPRLWGHAGGDMGTVPSSGPRGRIQLPPARWETPSIAGAVPWPGECPAGWGRPQLGDPGGVGGQRGGGRAAGPEGPSVCLPPQEGIRQQLPAASHQQLRSPQRQKHLQ